MEKRVQLINEMAKLTIQTRHFHDIQMEIIERTKNNLPDCLHGFDILLKRDLTNVSGICDSLENLTEEYIQTVIEEQLNLFEPAHMMSILNSTRLLENSQDIQLPEKILSSEIYAKNIHFGLEEYLQAKINYFIGIINLKYTNLNRKTNIPTDCENQVHLNYDKLSTVETIHKQFYHLCRDFMSCDYKDVITDLIQSTIVNSRGK
ncbi:unnamed protein product [Heterobilharzia americana]|nr:unnamed protein product [Heterobilharzia americana]